MEPMTYAEWTELVARLNTLYPHQQIDELTATAWYVDHDQHGPGGGLCQYTRDQVGRALARCAGHAEFISCYAIVQAIDDDKRERSATRSTALPLPDKGVPPGPEWAEMRKVLERSMLPPGTPNHLLGPDARRRLDELHRYRVARLAEQTTAPRRGQP